MVTVKTIKPIDPREGDGINPKPHRPADDGLNPKPHDPQKGGSPHLYQAASGPGSASSAAARLRSSGGKMGSAVGLFSAVLP